MELREPFLRVFNGPIAQDWKICVVTFIRCHECFDSMVLPTSPEARLFLDRHRDCDSIRVTLDPTLTIESGRFVWTYESGRKDAKK